MTSFEEKELAILRDAVDLAEKNAGKKLSQSDDVKNIITIVEHFIILKNLICYGGTAINNILPAQDRFYDKDVEIPDYDFFSSSALDHAKELADIYVSEGYSEVEAKAGMHHGTFKVYVNFIPVADITSIPLELFNSIKKKSLRVDGILYAPPDYLRMAMYLELSRPLGDVSRWEKVLKRLTLLNKNYPMRNPKCDNVSFMRDFEGSEKDANEIYDIVKQACNDVFEMDVEIYYTQNYGYGNTDEKKKGNSHHLVVDGISCDRFTQVHFWKYIQNLHPNKAFCFDTVHLTDSRRLFRFPNQYKEGVIGSEHEILYGFL